ncbi:cation diffusion facilitator family transporter [Paenibacillus thailandensis]
MFTKRDERAENLNWNALWSNGSLALLKGAAGWLFGSKALLADAFHSAAEASLAVAKIAGGRAGQYADGKHEHRRGASYKRLEEAVVNVVLSVVLLTIGLDIGISALRDLSAGVDEAPSWYALAAVIAGVLIKELLFRERSGRSAYYSSIAAAVGIGGAMIGEYASLPLLYYFDPAAAIVIAVTIIHSGYKPIAELVRKDTNGAVLTKDKENITQFIQRIEGVITVESVEAREQGHYVAADIVISVNPRISVLEGQEIGKRVKLLVMKRFAHITAVSVYVEPYDPGYPYKSNHDPNQEHMPTLIQ